MGDVATGGRKRHRGLPGGHLPESSAQSYVIADEDVRLGFLRAFTPRGKTIEPLEDEIYLGTGLSVEGLASIDNYVPLHNHYLPLHSYIPHYIHWGMGGSFAHWVDPVGLEQTPETFDLPPSSKRRARGKVRKYYEPATFDFVEDEWLNTENVEY